VRLGLTANVRGFVSYRLKREGHEEKRIQYLRVHRVLRVRIFALEAPLYSLEDQFLISALKSQ
jgi:hypothetical protein